MLEKILEEAVEQLSRIADCLEGGSFVIAEEETHGRFPFFHTIQHNLGYDGESSTLSHQETAPFSIQVLLEELNTFYVSFKKEAPAVGPHRNRRLPYLVEFLSLF